MKRLKTSIKNLIRPLYYRIYNIYVTAFEFFLTKSISDYKAIPIIINNRNRVTFLKQLIDSLEIRGYHNIYIIDNASTYSELIDYYDSISIPVIRLKENLGYLSLWKSGLYKKFYRNYYVYTDSDLVLINECPDDFMRVFLDEFKKDNDLYKVGFSLKIDDIPEHYNNKKEVIEWEKQFYEKRVSDLFFKARIDTTFALYRPGSTKAQANFYIKSYRSSYPYQVRHLPWYVDSENLPKEEKFYMENSSTSTHWTNISM